MVTDLKSIPDTWRLMPNEMHARRFLEGLIWQGGRFCPHCGSVDSSALRGQSCRPALYRCRDCRLQFTVTTRTPIHATKLDLRLWICAIFLVLTSSKGISSVVMARLLGVNQKTAWKMGHAIRQMMDGRNGELLPLEEVVEVDKAYVGGAPKSLFGTHAPRGRGTGKPMVLVAASRDDQARAKVVPNGQGATLRATLANWILPARTTLMTDGNPAYIKIGQTMAGHQSVTHSAGQYANSGTEAHVNTAEAVISQVQRALVGVHHHLGRKHLQRYLDEILWRWNHQEPAREVVRQWTTRSGATREKSTTIWAPIPVVSQMRVIFQGAIGKQMRRSKEYGLCWP